MLQLAENKRERYAQIAQKSKNAFFASAGFLEDGLLHFSRFFSPLRGPKPSQGSLSTHRVRRELEFCAPRCYLVVSHTSPIYPMALRARVERGE